MPLKPGQKISQSALPRPRMSATSSARKRVLTASASAQPRAGQEGFDPGGAVGQPDGHALAGLQSQVAQAGGQRGGPRAQLGGADGAVRVDQQGARGIGGGQRIQVSGEGVGNSVGDGHGVH